MASSPVSRFAKHATIGTLLAASAVSAFAADVAVPGMGTWETTLQGRDLDGNIANGFEAYYDTDLKITWLTDANYAGTIGYVSPSYNVDGGWMTYDEGVELAKTLSINGITGWRGPQLKDLGAPGCAGYANSGTDCGYNVDPSSSEIVHLFSVTLGNHSVANPDGTERPTGTYGLINSGPFKNIQTFGYGLFTPYAADSKKIWAFQPSSGIQVALGRESAGFAWFVHDGDIGTAAVPEPTSAALMLLGLAGIGALAARRKR